MSSHPVDVYPITTTIPPDLPLRNRMVVCITCHNIHAERFRPLGEKTYYLRRPGAGRAFCMACHKEKPVQEGHTSALGAAHIGNRFGVTDTSGHLDEISVACITCHDGTVGRSADFRLGSGVWQHSSPDQSHPIGVDYETSRMSMGYLKAKQLIDKRIRFFDGKIGCGTCHDMYLKSRNYLVMSNKGSRLCTSCHEL
jgi:predicted CXXCH cytochrome family protein